jgi:hypothetical protein
MASVSKLNSMPFVNCKSRRQHSLSRVKSLSCHHYSGPSLLDTLGNPQQKKINAGTFFFFLADTETPYY